MRHEQSTGNSQIIMEARPLNHTTQRSDIVIYILILFATTTLKIDNITMIYLHGMIVSFVVNVPVVLLDMFVVIVDMIVDIMNILVKKMLTIISVWYHVL